MNLPPTGMTLILGGARSGKSSFAEKIARETGRPALYIATATALDDEMRERIANHRAARPPGWQTLEAPLRVGEAALNFYAPPLPVEEGPGAGVSPLPVGEGQGVREPGGPIILDCITLLVSNALLSQPEGTPFETVMARVREEIESLLAAQQKIGGQWLVVSNEVGLGLVPPYPLGRIYRDALGWANQRLARAASEVILMVAGIPIPIGQFRH